MNRLTMSDQRDGYVILRELRRRQYNFTRVAKELGISHQLVRETAHGKNNNRKALRRMLEVGVPEGLLLLPPDLQGAARGVAA